MKFNKIKWSAKEKKVTLSWTEMKPTGDTIEHTLTSPDTPRPEFLESLADLRPFARDICEARQWGEAFRPIGVTLTDGKEARGVVITCLRNVGIVPAPVVVNTPHVTDDAWPRGLYDALAALEAEAEQYVQGNRAQTTLFPPGDQMEERRYESTVTIEAAGEKVTMSGEEFTRRAERIKAGR